MSTIAAIEKLNDADLVKELQSLRGKECLVIADLVLYLAELDKRQGYRELGYSSLYSFCTELLKYSEGAAQRRIIAARCLRDNPEVYQLLKEGKVSLCSLAEVAKVITPENKVEVLNLSQGLAKRGAQQLAAQYMAPQKPKRESIRAVRVVTNSVAVEAEVAALQLPPPVAVIEDRYSINLEIDAECMALINEAKELSGNFKLGSLLKTVLGAYLDKKRAKATVKAAEKPQVTKRATAPTSRYILKSVKDQVRVRDQHQCTYIAPNGKRCTERHGLEFDHKLPFYRGGESSVENLRLLCKAHNQLYAEQCFGKRFIQEKRRSAAATTFKVTQLTS